METSREDVGIAIRSALIDKGTKQKFSLFVLIILSIIFIYAETIEARPLNFFRSFLKDTIYRGALIVSAPSKVYGNLTNYTKEHVNEYRNYAKTFCGVIHYCCESLFPIFRLDKIPRTILVYVLVCDIYQ